MATSEAQSSAIEAAPTQETAHVYAMSKEGRRQAVVLLLGVASIWVFALWSLITILEGGITGIEWVSSVLMLGILLVAPLVGWGLLEEAYSRVSLGDAGVRYQTIGGLDVTYRWDDLVGFKKGRGRGRIARFFLGDGSDEEADPTRTGTAIPANEMDSNDEESSEDDPDTLLLEVREGHTSRIANPVLRFLHSQAHGHALPIYGGLENRDDLLTEINTRLGKS
jgi:hypothetical protein